jgi:hypothetical protein
MLALALSLMPSSSFLPAATAAAPSTNAASSLDYSSFKIISDRNIFNTRRSARYVASAPRTRASRSESFALVGTMSYEKGPLAFFDGTRSDYRKVLKPDDTIAGFKVTAIETTHVKLASPTNEVELRVGMQLRREEEGEWHMSERPENLEQSPLRASYTRSSIQNGARSTSAPDAAPPVGEPLAFQEGPPGFAPEGGPIGFVDPQTGLTNAIIIPLPTDAGAAGAAAPGGDVLDILRRRAAAERGEAPQ